jgi:hypothetical protein
LGPIKELIDAILITDPTAPGGHVWERLLDAHDVMASYSRVRKYIADRRLAPRRKRPVSSCVPAFFSTAV